jgi:hypothetical protein
MHRNPRILPDTTDHTSAGGSRVERHRNEERRKSWLQQQLGGGTTCEQLSLFISFLRYNPHKGWCKEGAAAWLQAADKLQGVASVYI